jgi:hypothetical protein
MGESRKHHYIPVFYQKHFTNDKGLLFIYDRKRQTYQELHPRSVCHQSDLYAIKPEGGPRDRRIETNILSDFDGMSAIAIRELAKLKPPTPPSPDTQAALTVFAALQHLRVPTNDVFMRSIYEAGASDLMEMMFSTVDRAKASLRRYELGTGEKVNVSAESMVDSVKNRTVEPKATEIPFLRSLGEHAGFIAQTLAGLSLEILTSPDATGFILTDNPFTIVPRQVITELVSRIGEPSLISRPREDSACAMG